MGSPLATEANAMADESFDETLDNLEAGFVMPPDPDLPVPVDKQKTQLDLFAVSMETLALLPAKCAALTCDTKDGYEATRQMIGNLRTLRGRVERRRKQHNEEAQKHIKWVNTNAKDLTNFIVNLEDPLKEMKLAVDDAKEREKKAAELAEQERLAQIECDKLAAAEAERLAQHAADKARLDAEAEKLAAERAELWKEKVRLEAEQRAERERQEADAAAERAVIEAERKKLADERAAMEAEKAALEAAERRRAFLVEQAERDRLAKIEAERLAAERAEREKQEEAERERLRVEAMPDAEAMLEFAGKLREISNDAPLVKSVAAKSVMLIFGSKFEEAILALESFNLN